MVPDSDLPLVVSQFSDALGHQIDRIQTPENAIGFSGTNIYQVTAQQHQYCLRCLPVQNTREQLAFSHHVLKHAANECTTQLPVPFISNTGETWVQQKQNYWQMESWMAGEPVKSNDWTDHHLQQAVDFLAQFHRSTSRLQFDKTSKQLDSLTTSQNCLSKSITDRFHFFKELNSGKLEQIKSALTQCTDSRLHQIGSSLCKGFMIANTRLTQAIQLLDQYTLPMIPVIRDCRTDHFLFSQAGELLACIDFGAMRLDTVAADLGRLFADTIVADQGRCERYFERYQGTCTLSIEEQHATIAMAQTTAMLSGLTWLDWILLEKRQFPSYEPILARLEHWYRQANRLVENMEKNDDIQL